MRVWFGRTAVSGAGAAVLVLAASLAQAGCGSDDDDDNDAAASDAGPDGPVVILDGGGGIPDAPMG